MEPQKIPLHTQYQVCGFSNPGNCCFLNAAMQLLRSIDALHYLTRPQSPFTFIQSFKESSSKHSNRLLDPTNSFYKAVELYLGYSPRAIRQNCACEFLRFFLFNLDQELEGAYPRIQPDDSWTEASQRNLSQSFNSRASGKSILYDLIGLSLKTETRARGHSSISYQDELIISLQVEEKLTTALERYFSSSSVESFQVSGVQTGCKMRAWVCNFAPYLIFHVQRFKVDNGTVFKVKSFVEYPKTIKIPVKCLSPSLRMAVENDQVTPPEYELKCIIEHHGEHANSGHYTAVVYNNGAWVLADDHLVRPVSKEFVRKRAAYVLLYQQVNREFL